MKRIFLENIQGGSNREQFARAFKLAEDFCKANVTVKSVIIYVPTMDNVEPIRDLFGEEVLDNILKGRGIKIYDKGPGILILSEKKIQGFGMIDSVVISTYGAYDTLTKADDLSACQAIIALPWSKDELNLWVETWNPDIIDQNGITKAQSSPKTISNSIVKKAISEISFRDISHPSDKENLVTKFKIFKKNNINYSTDEIVSYLIRERHWETEDAHEAKDIGDRINNGQRVNGGDFTNEKEALKRWSE